MAFEGVALRLDVDAAIAEFVHLGVGVEGEHEEDVDVWASGGDIVVALSPMSDGGGEADIGGVGCGGSGVEWCGCVWYFDCHAPFEVIGGESGVGVG